MSAFASKVSQYIGNAGIPVRDSSAMANHMMAQAGKLLESRRQETGNTYSAKRHATKAENVLMFSVEVI